LEKEQIERNNKYEKIIGEYKIKVENLIKVNDGIILQIHEHESKNCVNQDVNRNLENEIKGIENQKYDLEEDLNVLKRKCDLENREHKKLDEKHKELCFKVKQMMNVLTNHFIEQKDYIIQNHNLHEKLSYLFQS